MVLPSALVLVMDVPAGSILKICDFRSPFRPHPAVPESVAVLTASAIWQATQVTLFLRWLSCIAAVLACSLPGWQLRQLLLMAPRVSADRWLSVMPRTALTASITVIALLCGSWQVVHFNDACAPSPL